MCGRERERENDKRDRRKRKRTIRGRGEGENDKREERLTKQRKRRIMKKWVGKGAEGGRMIKIGEMRYCVKRRRIKIWEIKKKEAQ